MRYAVTASANAIYASAIHIGTMCLAMVLASACTSARTQVMVVVTAEPGVLGATQSLDVVVWGGATRDNLVEVARYDDRPAQFPFQIPIVPQGNDASRAFRVEVTAVDAAGAPVATVRAVSGFVAGRTLALELELDDDCIPVSCTDLSQTCDGGACGDAFVDPSSLSDYVPPGAPDAGMPPPPDGAAPECGNGTEEMGEACDDGDFNGMYGYCNSDCTGLGPYCGDGIVQPEEECEQSLEPLCGTDCRFPGETCGNANVDPGEICYGARNLAAVTPGSILQMQLANINNDGAIDLVILDTTRQLYVLYGLGDGGFNDPTSVPVSIAHAFVAADFDGDGRDEIAAAGAPCDSCLQLIAWAAGGFVTLATLNNALEPAVAPVAIDTDSDARPEVVVVGLNNLVARFEVDVGAGVIERRYMGSLNPVGPFPVQARAVPTPFGAILAVLKDDGNIYGYVSQPEFDGDPQLTAAATWGAIQSFAVGDLSGDGVPDVVAAGGDPLNTTVFQGSVALMLSQVGEASWPDLRATSGTMVTDLVDVSADGALEWIAGADALGIVPTMSTTLLAPPRTFPLACPVLALDHGLIDGDSAVDFAIATQCGDIVIVLANP
ncbi:MAG: FG-GAP-like repeat-containing protein [Sandaracinaceae bacterium]|nr:FG-GAP-like repeat-containing protein [Sandaracinaceae bacterium]